MNLNMNRIDEDKHYAREKYWIKHYNSVEDGYNSVQGNGNDEEVIKGEILKKDYM